jgi:hypothetical protein
MLLLSLLPLINFNFTSRPASLLLDKCRIRIMETYGCCKKNSIIDNYLNPNFNPALVPCIKEKCPRWGEWEGRGGCILVTKSGTLLRMAIDKTFGCKASVYCDIFIVPKYHFHLHVPIYIKKCSIDSRG